MPTYIVRRPMTIRNVSLLEGDEVPEALIVDKQGNNRIDPDSWAAQGHFLRLTAAEAKSIATLREKRNAAREAYFNAEYAFTEKLKTLEQRKG